MLEHVPPEATHAIIGCFLETHRRLGPGLLESAYQDGLEIEFRHQGVLADREVRLPIHYRDQVLRTVYRADFICEPGVLVELKSGDAVTAIDEAQIIHYLRITGLRVGLLVYFGGTSAVWRRYAV